MEQLFTTLTKAIYGTPLIAVAASFAWGIISIVLSPCHLSSIPLIIGFIGSRSVQKTNDAFILSLLFSMGILVTIAGIGLITGLAGSLLGDIGPWGNYIVAVVFLIVGIYLLGIIDLSWLSGGINQPRIVQNGYLTALILGLIFGIALGPCTFAFMMPILGVVFSIASTRFMFALSLLCAYAAGHCGVIILAGTFSTAVQKYLHWNEKSHGVTIMKKICGILVLIGGIYLIYKAR